MTERKHETRRHTYADYLTWPDSQSGELVDGVAYVREPPAPSPSHQLIVFELGHHLRCALEQTSYRVFVAPLDVRLPKASENDDQVDTVVQPDVLIVPDMQKVDARGMRGAPDWIAEVLSPGTARYDRNVKIPAYERAGVPEAWLVDPIERTVAIYLLEDGRYRPAIVRGLTGVTRITAVPEVAVDWSRLLAQMV